MQSAKGLEFGLLGPLEVRRDDRLVPVRGWRERAVLAMLLLAEGGNVTLERLVEGVWDGDPPWGAVKAVRNCVSALRGRLAEPGGQAAVIQSTPAGYRLPIEGVRLDILQFRREVEAARRLSAAGRITEAAAGLRAALALWRGPALAGTGSAIVHSHAARLNDQRMTALEDCLDLELALGRHRQVAGELQALVRECPLRERLAGQLMLALYRSGRQAEALEAYARLAGRLAEDLGIDPTAEITQLHQAILRQAPSLDVPPAPSGSCGRAGASCARASCVEASCARASYTATAAGRRRRRSRRLPTAACPRRGR